MAIYLCLSKKDILKIRNGFDGQVSNTWDYGRLESGVCIFIQRIIRIVKIAVLLDEILLVGKRVGADLQSEVLIAPVNSGSCYVADAVSPDSRRGNGLIHRILDIDVQLTISNISTNESHNQKIIIECVQTRSKYCKIKDPQT